MNRDKAKRPQSVVLGVKRLDPSGASRERPHPPLRSMGSLAGSECKGRPAPHRDPETPRPTRTTIALAVLRIFSVPALWLLREWRRRSRKYRDRRLLANWSDAMLRDVGLRREEVDRDFWRR
jgi:hypothetical protein